jgi:hypothetical protein
MGLFRKVGGFADHMVAPLLNALYGPVTGTILITQIHQIPAANGIGGLEILETDFSAESGLHHLVIAVFEANHHPLTVGFKH